MGQMYPVIISLRNRYFEIIQFHGNLNGRFTFSSQFLTKCFDMIFPSYSYLSENLKHSPLFVSNATEQVETTTVKVIPPVYIVNARISICVRFQIRSISYARCTAVKTVYLMRAKPVETRQPRDGEVQAPAVRQLAALYPVHDRLLGRARPNRPRRQS